MISFFKQGIGFIKKNPEILYSLFLVIVLPLVLYFNTVFTIKSFQENIDFTLQSNALLVEKIFGNFASEIISQPEILQEKIKLITEENPEISNLRVAILENDKFKIIAALNPEEIGIEMKGDPVQLSWHKNQAIAYKIANEKKERFWEVISPIQDSTGNKIGLISLSSSLKTSDTLVFNIVKQAYLIVIAAILLTLFLIIQHTRLFRYPVLLKKIQEVDRMKDEFIRMATHELQSPIVNIRNYAQAFAEEVKTLPLTENQKEYLSRVIISTERLTALISDILDVSRIEQERISLVPEKVFPPKIIKEIVGELELKAQDKGLTTIFEEKLEPFFIEVNSNRLKEVLYNLIDNAIKYTLEGGVEIKTEVDEIKKKYYITVQDSGIGISAEAQQRLFEKFYRVKTKETADISGTGLGLWIAKTLARKMGGDILIESMEGKGSKFTIIFPLKRG